MSSLRTKKAAINVSVAAVGKILMIIIGFVSRTIFIRNLSVEYLGINGLFSNILTLLSFSELGIGNAIVFSMYKPLKNQDTKILKSLMAMYKNAYTIIAMVVALAGLFIAPFLNYIIKDAPDIKDSLVLIFLLYLLDTVLSYVFTYKKSILTADQNDYIVSIWQNVFYIIQQILQMYVLILNHNFIQYLWIQIICSLLNNLIIAKIANNKYPYITEKNIEKLPISESRQLVRDIKALAISKISGVVMNGTDNIVISTFLGLSSVGVVSNYSMIINYVNGIIWSALSGVTASVGDLNTEQDIKHKKEIFDQVFLISYWIYSSICICLLILLNLFIKIWIGNPYLVDNLTVFSLVLIVYTSGVNFPAYTFRTTMGFFDQVKYIYILSAFLNIILSILLGKWLGVAGVFLATSISRLVTIEIADGIYVYRKGLKIPSALYFKKYILCFGIFILNFYITYNVIFLVEIDGIVGFLIKGFICVILSNMIIILFFYKTKEFKALILKINGLSKILINKLNK